MTKCIAFEAVSAPDARILILGSLPGVESLKQRRYYAKKTNSFWPIISRLIKISPDAGYQEKLQALKKHHIALWDVCAAATRKGSLDSNIELATIAPNNFDLFFKKHKQIKLICFNGQTAHKFFIRFVLEHLSLPYADIKRVVLPSTSPAHATLAFEEKYERWHEILGKALKRR